MNREIKFKAKNENENRWLFCEDPMFEIYYIQGFKADLTTLCQLITKIGDVEIYEYDCYMLDSTDQMYLGFVYFYYENGLLHRQFCYIFNDKIETSLYLKHIVSNYKLLDKPQFIGNCHDGEEYLLNKIKKINK